ncbi:MAG: (5-formylfuran-3-yl)methyl phosphate synthase [Pirellulaceae bacterium]|jgi:hypothetical protein|nr:(5-formylfuran-3-yl)methyl phosphate synthase [Pirellulaceae bacterium]MDP6554114.1 (5-formylfuran-3-yl)methyl phosphate synthase [Pirellulaceae bacterium]MDP6718509.1 (5-formylfuran-3-yl)methyl phosphate synthase [Pirellulaceae bacterium]
MTGLLVSVRDANEAQQALAGGADVIDVKEPARGALGAADPEVWHHVRRAIPLDVRLSVALGELTDDDIGERASCVQGIQYAKVGLAGCLDLASWQRRWEQVLARLPAETERVAVGYADHRTARAPDPTEVLRAAPAANCRTLLLDTFAKDQGDLFDHLGDNQLTLLVRECHAAGVVLALAGSVQLTSIDRALSFAPTLIAVRGAACSGDRTGTVCRRLVKRLKRRITANSNGGLISN